MKQLNLLLVNIFFLLAYCGFAQNSADTNKIEPQAFEFFQLSRQLEASTSAVQKIKAGLVDPQELVKWKAAIDTIKEIVLIEDQFLDPNDANNIILTNLNDLKNYWLRVGNEYGKWEKKTSDHIKDNQIYRDSLDRMNTSWAKTLEEQQHKLPQSTISNIHKLQNEFQQTRKLTDQRLRELLTLQDEMLAHVNVVNQQLQLIEKATNGFTQNLLEFDMDEIWVADSSLNLKGLFKKKLLLAEKYKFNNYLKAHKEQFAIYILLFFLFAWLFYLLWKNSDGGQFVYQIRLIKNKPVVTFVYSLVVIVLLYFRDSPLTVAYALVLISLPPFYILANTLNHKKFKWPLLFFVIISSFYIFSNMIAEHLALQRLLNLLLNVLIILLVLFMIYKRKWMEGISVEWLRKLTAKVLWGMLVLLALTMLSNIFGNLLFSRFVIRAIVESIYAGILLGISIVILKEIIQISLGLPSLQKLNIVYKYPAIIREKLFRWLDIIVWTYFVITVLRRFLIFDVLYEAIESFVLQAYEIGNLKISLWSIISFLLTLWIGLTISRFIRFLLEEEILIRQGYSIGIRATISMLVRYALITLAFLFAISAAGFDVNQLTVLIGALGVGIGFGLQNIFNNLVSGLILAFERPVGVNDVVEVGAYTGVLMKINFRSSIIRTWDGSEVMVPNGNLISNEVINWTKSDNQRRIEILVGVAYGTDPQHVINLLLSLTKDRPDILDNPPPYALFLGFGDSSLNFSLRYWTADRENWLTNKSDMTVRINNILKENNIEIPFPQRDLHIRSNYADKKPEIIQFRDEKPLKQNSGLDNADMENQSSDKDAADASGDDGDD